MPKFTHGNWLSSNDVIIKPTFSLITKACNDIANFTLLASLTHYQQCTELRNCSTTWKNALSMSIKIDVRKSD